MFCSKKVDVLKYILYSRKKSVQSKFWQEPMFLHVLAKLSKIIDPMFMAFKRRKHGNNLLIKYAFDVSYIFYTSKIHGKITTEVMHREVMKTVMIHNLVLMRRYKQKLCQQPLAIYYFSQCRIIALPPFRDRRNSWSTASVEVCVTQPLVRKT